MPPKDATERKAIAYHEAGHAVVYIVQRIPISLVTTEPLNQDKDCYCETPYPKQIPWVQTKAHLKEAAIKMIRGKYAGIIAQRLVDPDPKSYEQFQDNMDVITLCRHYITIPENQNSAHLLDQFKVESDQLVAVHASLIAAVAERLLEVETMTHADVVEVMVQHDWAPE